MSGEIKLKKWSNIEYVRAYHRNRYRLKNGLVEEDFKENRKHIDWSDPSIRKIYHLSYYHNHKDAINEKRKQGQTVCSLCFGTYTNDSKTKHFKTLRHTRAIKEETPTN